MIISVENNGSESATRNRSNRVTRLTQRFASALNSNNVSLLASSNSDMPVEAASTPTFTDNDANDMEIIQGI